MLLRTIGLLSLVVSLCADAHGAVELKNDRCRIEVEPATLETRFTVADGTTVELSRPLEAQGGSWVVGNDFSARWERGGLLVGYVLVKDELRVTFTSRTAESVTWPVVDVAPPAKGLILPTFEGVYVPADDAEWRAFLLGQSPLDTTAGLSMPFWGIDVGKHTITYLFPNAFNNEAAISDVEGKLRLALTHEFVPRETPKSYSVIIRLGDRSPVEPARQYRRWLIENKQFVPMAEKIKRTPRAERLLGAAHAYLWGDGLLSRYDVRDWKRFCAKLKSHAMWQLMSEPARKAADEIIAGEGAADYLKNEVAVEIGRLLATPQFADRAAFAKAFDGNVLPPEQWGDGISLTMLGQLKEAGLDRLCITTGDLLSAQHRPDVARHADELGYVFGPYDSYHSIHAPGAADTWSTAQFDQALYDTGAIIKRDGTPRHGFKKKGYLLSPLAAEPYVHKRVGALVERVPFTSWFVDCDAFGEVFDDYSPQHPATQAEDAAARAKRMRWISETYGVPVGSEGGSAYAIPAVHFAHGVMTPVIGWGDAALKDKSSPYYLGAYWPPDGPQVFVKQVPLKPQYAKFYFDPRYRLPLHQTVFHDSVIATHHWSAASLKFADQVQTVALLELLYNVPPLYHLNRAEWKKHRERIASHYAFFSLLHRETALLPMTDFAWLSDDRLVQRTVFGEKVEIVANFGDNPVDRSGVSVAPRSVMSRRLDTGEIRHFSPAP
jgi:hypothetical protein